MQPQHASSSNADQKSLDDFYVANAKREKAEKKQLQKFYQKTKDSERGIGKITVSAEYAETPPEAVLEKTTERQFDAKKSVAARAHTNERKQGASTGENERNFLAGEADTDNAGERFPAEQLRQNVRTRVTQELSRATLSRTVRSRMTQAQNWWLIGVAWTIYLFQLPFSIASAVGFGLWGTLGDFNNTWVGRVVGLFVDIAKFFKVEELSLAMWAISALLILGAFFSLFLYYILRGIQPLSSVVSTLLCFLLVFCSIYPFVNLFPWIVLWVVYVNLSALFSRRT